MQTKMLINGELATGDGDALDILDSATAGIVGTVAEASSEQVEAISDTGSPATGMVAMRMDPLVSAAHRSKIAGFVERSRGSRKIVQDGNAGSGDGFFYEPTLIANAYTAIRHVMLVH